MAKPSSRTLLLLRHAKAVPAEAGGEDRERPLAPRGHEDARAAGKHIADRGYKPDVILCSPSKRTAETLEHLLPFLGAVQSMRYEEALYLADKAQLLAHVHKLEAKADCALLIGHNPGMEELALTLAEPEGNEFKRMTEKFPTAALCVLEFKTVTWRDVRPGEGHLREFARPKDLD